MLYTEQKAAFVCTAGQNKRQSYPKQLPSKRHVTLGRFRPHQQTEYHVVSIIFIPDTKKKASLNDVAGNSCSQTLKGSLPASSKSSAMVLTEADPGIVLISTRRGVRGRLRDSGRGACQEQLAGRAQAPGSCPSVGVRRTLTWSDPLLCLLPEVTAVHGRRALALMQRLKPSEGRRRRRRHCLAQMEAVALFSQMVVISAPGRECF